MEQTPTPTQRPSLLIVDDEPHGLRLLASLLEEAGYRVEVAVGADDAQRKLHCRRFDLALVELAMKQVSGIRLIEIIKDNPLWADTPVLAVTTPVQPSLARPLGCEGFVFRPIELPDLLRAVRSVCRARSPDAAVPAG